MHTRSPHKPSKLKQTSALKLMVTVFRDWKGVLMVEFLEQGTTVMSQIFCETKLRRAIQNKRRRMLTCGVVFLHDNMGPHTSTAARTRILLDHLNRELFDHTPYSHDIAPSDYCLFTLTCLKSWLR
jgi:hypothetical protein